MKVKEFIELVNANNKHFETLFDFEDKFKKITGSELPKKIKEGLHPNSCEYYSSSTTIYSLKDGFVGVTGIDDVFADDFDEYWDKCEAYEYIQVPTITYQVKKED